MSRFGGEARAALLAAGWRLIEVPAGLSLERLRAGGAPFKSDKYFARLHGQTVEADVAGGEVAYRPGLMPGSLNQAYEVNASLLARLAALLPPGAAGTVAPAALYVWLLVEHHRRHGEWLLRQCFTWAADTHLDAHLAVGVMGQQRPIMVTVLPEGRGRGVGLLPVVVPAPEDQTAGTTDS